MGVVAIWGTLVTCDAAMKELIMHIDGQRAGPERFVVMELDDGALLVKEKVGDEDIVEMLRARMKEYQDDIAYKKPDVE